MVQKRQAAERDRLLLMLNDPSFGDGSTRVAFQCSCDGASSPLLALHPTRGQFSASLQFAGFREPDRARWPPHRAIPSPGLAHGAPSPSEVGVFFAPEAGRFSTGRAI